MLGCFERLHLGQKDYIPEGVWCSVCHVVLRMKE